LASSFLFACPISDDRPVCQCLVGCLLYKSLHNSLSGDATPPQVAYDQSYDTPTILHPRLRATNVGLYLANLVARSMNEKARLTHVYPERN